MSVAWLHPKVWLLLVTCDNTVQIFFSEQKPHNFHLYYYHNKAQESIEMKMYYLL
jgi:hypothetical protein